MTTDVEDAVYELADALGDDFRSLSPAGERRFDPASVGLAVAAFILWAVADGIRDGVKEASKRGTVAMLESVSRAVGDRLVPSSWRSFFSRAPTDQQLSQQQDLTTREVIAARAAVGALAPESAKQLSVATAVAVATALGNSGLSADAAERVRRKVEIQVLRIIVTPEA